MLSVFQAQAWEITSTLNGYLASAKEKVNTFCASHPITIKLCAGAAACCTFLVLAGCAWKKYIQTTPVDSNNVPESSSDSDKSDDESSSENGNNQNQQELLNVQPNNQQPESELPNIKTICFAQDTINRTCTLEIKLQDESKINYDMQHEKSCISNILQDIPINLCPYAPFINTSCFFISQYTVNNNTDTILALLHEVKDNAVILKRIDLLDSNIIHITKKEDDTIEYQLNNGKNLVCCTKCTLTDAQFTMLPILYNVRKITKQLEQEADECRYFYQIPGSRLHAWWDFFTNYFNRTQEPIEARMNMDEYDRYSSEYENIFLHHRQIINTVLKDISCCEPCKGSLQSLCCESYLELKKLTQDLESEITDKMSTCVARNVHQLVANFENKTLANLKKNMSTSGSCAHPYELLGLTKEDWMGMNAAQIQAKCNKLKVYFSPGTPRQKIYEEIQSICSDDVGKSQYDAYINQENHQTIPENLNLNTLSTLIAQVTDATQPYAFLGIPEETWNKMKKEEIGTTCNNFNNIFPKNSSQDKAFREIQVLSRCSVVEMWKAYARWQQGRNPQAFNHLILYPNGQKYKKWAALWPKNTALKFQVSSQL